jgi:hypothetical protein
VTRERVQVPDLSRTRKLEIHIDVYGVCQDLAVTRSIHSLFRSIWCLISRGRNCRGDSIMRVRHLCGALALLSIFNCHEARCKSHPKLALDSAKPFVYIEFDHTGPRQPLEPDEPSRGLWLRLVNNSVLRITLRVHGSPFDDLPLVQDIITPQMRMIPKSGLPDYGPMPRGYATGSDVASLLTIEPGKQIVFSVPVNHVAPGWLLQVSFEFALPPTEHGAAQPVCYAAFAWDDVPEKSRWVPTSR